MLGLYGPGMHGFIMDEVELGTRVAMAQDAEDAEGAWAAYLFATMPPPCCRWPTCDVFSDNSCTWPTCGE